MVKMDSDWGGPGSSTRRCVVFLGETVYFHSAFLYPGEFTAGRNLAMD